MKHLIMSLVLGLTCTSMALAQSATITQFDDSWGVRSYGIWWWEVDTDIWVHNPRATVDGTLPGNYSMAIYVAEWVTPAEGGPPIKQWRWVTSTGLQPAGLDEIGHVLSCSLNEYDVTAWQPSGIYEVRCTVFYTPLGGGPAQLLTAKSAVARMSNVNN